MFRKIAIIFSIKILLSSTIIYGQCPTISDILDHGYNVGSDPAQPTINKFKLPQLFLVYENFTNN